MSGWQAYITSMTESSPAIKRAAIIGTDGSVWARTQNANAFRVNFIFIKDFFYCNFLTHEWSDIVRLTEDDSWEDIRVEKNARKCAAVGEEGEKSTLSARILDYRRV
ncbi:hypothetical protein Y032_0151g2836 [Ancylostoma ceylanicum]|uniref:Profilin n=1 Tax=Ancylostoma ceylanicum TaxID=53326 RepID=A0A016T0W5_9BILA|nr:hypothetical protein Y032_0151g2836 [Ancylostoma ceylanicum]